MRQSKSTTADKCLLPTDKSCKRMKANVSKLRSASYVDGIASRRTLVGIHGGVYEGPPGCYSVHI